MRVYVLIILGPDGPGSKFVHEDAETLLAGTAMELLNKMNPGQYLKVGVEEMPLDEFQKLEAVDEVHVEE